MVPAASLLKRTPSSVARPSLESAFVGTVLGAQIEHGHETFAVFPTRGLSTFALSAEARVRMTVPGCPWAIHGYVQLLVPDAGCQVVPPSVETSTPATT